jgi:3-dehydroquinate dehydratase-2
MLGFREKEIYGSMNLEEVNLAIKRFAKTRNIDIQIIQINNEGEIIEAIHDSLNWANGIVINPGAFAHYSFSIRDAISSVNLPTIEVHLTNIYRRETFRHKSIIAPVCIGQICGFGVNSYFLGLSAIVNVLK